MLSPCCKSELDSGYLAIDEIDTFICKKCDREYWSNGDPTPYTRLCIINDKVKEMIKAINDMLKESSYVELGDVYEELMEMLIKIKKETGIGQV